MSERIALITGCSSGLGQALVEQFEEGGWYVYAGVRTLDSKNLQARHPVSLDITEATEFTRIIERIYTEKGRVDLLVNNAGYGQMGPLLDLPADALRRQFETNVFAPVALIKGCFPLLKKSSRPIVVNIGSVSGELITPFGGAYCASKAAFNALSDTFRMELATLGVRVMTVKPGGLSTQFAHNAKAGSIHNENGPYLHLGRYIEKRANASSQSKMTAPQAAYRIRRAVERHNPPRSLYLGHGALSGRLLARFLPPGVRDWLLGTYFGLR